MNTNHDDSLSVTFGHFVKSGVPFNPVGGLDADGTAITGLNVERLQKSMRAFGWTDPRFVTFDQAVGNGWDVGAESKSVAVRVRRNSNGQFEDVFLYNAQQVKGMPSLQEMLAMSDDDLKRIRHPELSKQVVIEMNDDLLISPAPMVMVDQSVVADLNRANFGVIENNYQALAHVSDNEMPKELVASVVADDVNAFNGITDPKLQFPSAVMIGVNAKSQVDYSAELNRVSPNLAHDAETALTMMIDEAQVEEGRERDAKAVDSVDVSQSLPLKPPVAHQFDDAFAKSIENEQMPLRFAVMAPYWRQGLHNTEGLALAEKLNQTIRLQKLAEDKEAIMRLFALHPGARELGLDVVDEQLYLSDSDLKRNPAQPSVLLDGALLRDQSGFYRPNGGGKPVLEDKGDSLVLKERTELSYRGAMELAAAKGWKSIEIKGKPAVLAAAWLEAKLMGLEVVNYSPTKEDQEKFAKRLAEESKQKQAMQQTGERVEIRPFVNEKGEMKTASVTYTVSYPGGESSVFNSPKDAAKAFGGLAAAIKPVVVRSVTRADGRVDEDVIAGFAQSRGSEGVLHAADVVVDAEFDQAMDEVATESKLATGLNDDRVKVGSDGLYSGQILAVEGNMFAQKTGRDSNVVVWHDITKIKGKFPKIGDVLDIKYKNGAGVIAEKNKGKDVER